MTKDEKQAMMENHFTQLKEKYTEFDWYLKKMLPFDRLDSIYGKPRFKVLGQKELEYPDLPSIRVSVDEKLNAYWMKATFDKTVERVVFRYDDPIVESLGSVLNFNLGLLIRDKFIKTMPKKIFAMVEEKAPTDKCPKGFLIVRIYFTDQELFKLFQEKSEKRYKAEVELKTTGIVPFVDQYVANNEAVKGIIRSINDPNLNAGMTDVEWYKATLANLLINVLWD